MTANLAGTTVSASVIELIIEEIGNVIATIVHHLEVGVVVVALVTDLIGLMIEGIIRDMRIEEDKEGVDSVEEGRIPLESLYSDSYSACDKPCKVKENTMYINHTDSCWKKYIHPQRGVLGSSSFC